MSQQSCNGSLGLRLAMNAHRGEGQSVELDTPKGEGGVGGAQHNGAMVATE